MPIPMNLSPLRRLLFDRLVFNLALLLGLSQALVWHWIHVVGRAAEPPGLLASSGLAAALVLANGLAVPRLRRARRKRGLEGRLARGYMGFGVAMLLVGLAVLLSWAALLLGAGLLGALGASPAAGFAVFRTGSVALVGVVALSVVGGFTWGQARIERTRIRVRVPGLSPDLEGLRVVQISDLHIGNHLDGPRLSRMVERTNALDPDVLVLTGDLFDFDPEPVEDGVRRLAALRARHGVYAVLGNHDHYVGADRIADAIARLAPNIRLLRDEIAALPVGAPLYLAGADDPGRDWSARRLTLDGLADLAGARHDDGPTLLLVHRPEAFPQAAELGFPLVISGHTHGGQLALPVARGQYNLASLVTRFTRGLYRLNGSTLYVNRGLGVGGPALRIHCPREIATLELVGG
jgi:predicted MPP superfamily phosphohydrolase